MWMHLYIVVFKQRTAYEMRISDWSSDVCSSDLVDRGVGADALRHDAVDHRLVGLLAQGQSLLRLQHTASLLAVEAEDHAARAVEGRSDERRVGNECVSTCSSRWSTYL